MSIRVKAPGIDDDEFTAVWLYVKRVTREGLDLKNAGNSRHIITNEALLGEIGI